MISWLWAVLSDPLNGVGYAFWSGIGSGSPLLAAVGLWWHHHNCHVVGCWRLQWHHNEAGHPVCKLHHPDHPKGTR